MPPSTDPSDYARALIEETNRARAARNLPRLADSGCLAREALARAAALVGSELRHADLEPVIEACSPAGGTAAENLSRSSRPPVEIVTAWLDSPGHANNLLSPQLTAIGVGCVADGEEILCSELLAG